MNSKNVPTHGFFRHDGIDFEYDVSGDLNAPALVLLSGNGGDYHCFENDLLEPLSKSYRIVRFSVRGTGNTPLGSKRLTFDLFCDDLKALLDYLGICRTYICGFSDGGNLAICFTLKHRGYVRKVIAIGSNINTLGTKPNVQLGIIRDYLVYALRSGFGSNMEYTRRMMTEGMMVGQPGLKYSDLAGINVPFLNIYGENDIIRRAHSRRITKSIPGAKEVMVLNSGHGFSKETSDFLIYPVIRSFLED